ncbi:MAG: hypothetical protein SGILL_006011 [Bacillariaceae sp.]
MFFMFGQSNMQGHGCPDHLYELATNPATSGKFGSLYDLVADDWAERSDVIIRDCNNAYSLDHCSHPAPLKSVGYGATEEVFGPETGFGWRLGDSLDEDVFICKVAWGGKDLSIDLRPPSSTNTFYNGTNQRLANKYTMSEQQEELGYSFFYNMALEVFQDCIYNAETYAPGYDHYDPSGIVFFQAWNDLINPEKVGEYQYNLVNLINDMRSDLGIPDLPFIVGETGQHTSEDIAAFLQDEDVWLGQQRYNRVMGMRWAQGNATRSTMSAALAETSLIVDSSDRCPTYASGATHEEVCSCDGYHYFNNAQIIYDIGALMGNEMLSLHILRQLVP